MAKPDIHYESTQPRPRRLAPRLGQLFLGLLALYIVIGGLAGFGGGFGKGPACVPVHGAVMEYITCANRLHSWSWNIFVGWPRMFIVPLSIVVGLLRGAIINKSLLASPRYLGEAAIWLIYCVPFFALTGYGWWYWRKQSRIATKIGTALLAVLWLAVLVFA